MRRNLGPLAVSLLAVSCAAAPAVRQVVEPQDGVILSYEVRGDGPTAVVFIHDWCGARWHWESQMRRYSDEYTTVGIDLRAHGESTGHGRTEWTIRAFSRDVVAVVDDLGLGEVILVGHAMGGAVALESARRLGDRVNAVIGVNSVPDVELRFLPEEIEAESARIESDYDAAIMEILPGTTRILDQRTAGRVREQMLASDPAVAASLNRSMWSMDFRRALTACPVPFFCINASDVFITNGAANSRAARVYELVQIKGIGYYPMLEGSSVFERALDDVLARAVERAGRR